MPALQKKLQDMALYEKLWTPEHTEDRQLLLTCLSDFVAEGEIRGPGADAIMKRKELFQVLNTLVQVMQRVVKLPEDFEGNLKAHIESMRKNERLGLWAPWKPGAIPHDFTALAIWLNKANVAAWRERLNSKRAGPTKWVPDGEKLTKDARPYLARERDALVWLGKITTLHGGEAQRLKDLDASKPSKSDGVTDDLESLKLQPVGLVEAAPFRAKYGEPVTTNSSPEWTYLYFPKGDFTVQVNAPKKLTANVYRGRMP